MKTVYYSSCRDSLFSRSFTLRKVFTIDTGIISYSGGGNEFVRISPSGLMWIKPRYVWDGASGPAITTKNFIRGSLVHDSLYQLIRIGVLDMSQRKDADDLLYKILNEDGMWVRKEWVYAAVRLFGGLYLNSESGIYKECSPDAPIEKAPE